MWGEEGGRERWEVGFRREQLPEEIKLSQLSDVGWILPCFKSEKLRDLSQRRLVRCKDNDSRLEDEWFIVRKVAAILIGVAV